MTDDPISGLSRPVAMDNPNPPVKYPRPIEQIHQIEPASICNLRCQYCPSPKLEKLRGVPSQFMAMDVYERALEWVTHFRDQGTQGELSLTGIGESLMHPHFTDMLRLAREALPSELICFSTNGILLDDRIAAACAEQGVGVYVSLHRPEKAGPAVNIAKRHGILLDVNASPSVSAMDWAGQVPDWEVTSPSYPCEFLRSGWGVVLADGKMDSCCLDASNAGIVGTVWDEPGSLSIKPFSLCEACHMNPAPAAPGSVL